MNAATEPAAPTTPPPKRSRPSLDAVCEWMATDWSPWHVVLSGLTWADYQRLLDARAAADRPGVRITYSFGEAEVVTTGSTHERWKTLLVGLFEVYLEERWGDVVPCGNMTLDRKDLQNGFEPDACYYLHPTPDLLVVRQLDFSTDPPPDLALEVEVSRSVVGRLPIYAAFRIPEIWRYDGQAVTVMRLQPDNTYLAVPNSVAVPGFPFADLARYLQMADTVGYLTILRQFRAWVRQTLAAARECLMSAYTLNTPDDQAAMLARIGAKSVDELFAPVPPALRLNRPLAVPPALSEIELTDHIAVLAAKNRPAGDLVCFLGGGAYDHFIPSVVDAVAGRSEYYTAYTPYQAEASQGTLQAVFEYQTLMCQLTGLPVANASLYEGGSAVAEAVLMALGVTGRTGEVLIAESAHPEYRQVLATYVANLHCTVRTLPTPDGFLNPDDVAKAVNDSTVAVIAQSPNFFGHLEEIRAIGDAARKAGAVFIASFDPVSVGLLKRPGDYGADIAVAEGQGLGVPFMYGGPYLGVLACRDDKEYLRKVPGRLVGQTVDRHGKRCWVLTLQTREQHIRREKATSNICTNQSLLALRAAVHLTALGPQGLKETAELCVRKAHYAAQQLAKVPGVSLKFKTPFVKEFTLSVSGDVDGLLAKLRAAGYHAGLPAGRWYPNHKDGLTVAVTEKRTKREIDGLVEAVRAAVKA